MSAKKSPEERIADYRAAYAEANGYGNCPRVSYERGWFSIESVWLPRRYRAAQIDEMTDRLRRRTFPNGGQVVTP